MLGDTRLYYSPIVSGLVQEITYLVGSVKDICSLRRGQEFHKGGGVLNILTVCTCGKEGVREVDVPSSALQGGGGVGGGGRVCSHPQPPAHTVPL